MEIETKVISTEIITPSSPTPEYLKKYEFSLLDQVVPRSMIPIVYFYSSNPEIPNSQKTNHLKKSLSNALSRFYPLAGRLVDNLHVDCNDNGVPFVEAVANCDLSEVITNPDLDNIKKHLVCNMDGSQSFFLAVQATYFHCGGLTIGIHISHKIADAFSLVMFGNTWSAVAINGGDGSITVPKFDGAAYFPPGDVPLVDPTTVDLVTKAFTFSASKIALIQESYSAATNGGHRPGRVEALSAYISTRLISAIGMRTDPTKSYLLLHPVNLRSRINPPMLKYCFGNIGWVAKATLKAGDGGAEVVEKLREAKKAIIKGFVPQLKDVNELLMLVDSKIQSRHVHMFSISSLCGYPLYEADFGWGKPVWVVIPRLPIQNIFCFTDTKSGGGIEVVFTLTKQDMKKFEVDLKVSMFRSNL